MPACGRGRGFPARRSCPIGITTSTTCACCSTSPAPATARRLILTDGVFSMDGDLAPLPALGRLAREYDAWLMADDAHGIGVLGRGRGSTFATGTAADVPLQMGTLSKAHRRLWRLSLRLRAGDRADEEPRAHPHLLHRPAPGDRRRGRSLPSISSPPILRSPPRRSPRRAPSPPVPACRRRGARSCR